MTAEQLEAARAERLRQNGHGTLVLEDARTWVEETGLCHFLPRRQQTPSVAPSFVEAVAGREDATPDPRFVTTSEELLVRLEADDVALRLNLQGQPTEQPDYIVAAWVLPYVYALRGDRDWRRTPQLTGSRQVSPLAIQAYRLLEVGDATILQLRTALGREVSEAAVLRAITELWQQLRIVPVVSAPGAPARWQLLRHRFQKAIAEGASTSQVTAISVLASIYLQAVIAASMEEVELFLAPLTSRSKVREVLRGLVATRQVNTTTVGHSSFFYVAGTLPEFAPPPTVYANASISTYNYGYRGREEELEIMASAAVVETANGHSAPSATHPTPKPHSATEHPRVAHRPAPRPGGKPSERHSRPGSSARPASTGVRPARKTAESGGARSNGNGSRSTSSRASGVVSNGNSHSNGSARNGAFQSAGLKSSRVRSAAKPGLGGARKAVGSPVRSSANGAKNWPAKSGTAKTGSAKTSANTSTKTWSAKSGVTKSNGTRSAAKPTFEASSSRKTSGARSASASKPREVRVGAARTSAARTASARPASARTGTARSASARPASARTATTRSGSAKTAVPRSASGSVVRRKPAATTAKKSSTESSTKRSAPSRSASKRFAYAAPHKQESGKRK